MPLGMLLSKLVMLRGEIAIAHRLSWNQSRKRDALALILLFAVEVKKVLLTRIGPPKEPPN